MYDFVSELSYGTHMDTCASVKHVVACLALEGHLGTQEFRLSKFGLRLRVKLLRPTKNAYGKRITIRKETFVTLMYLYNKKWTWTRKQTNREIIIFNTVEEIN